MKAYINFDDTNEAQCLIRNLQYGENPHQKANLYIHQKQIDWTLLKGCELTYNEIIDASLSLEITAEFYDVCACTIVKHAIPSAVALSSDIEKAFDKALDSDPTSPLGGTICFSKEVNTSLARKLKTMAIKMLIAPSFEPEALNILKTNQNLKIIQINSELKEVTSLNLQEIKLTPFGALIQQKDNKDLDVKTFKVTTKTKPEQSQVEDMIFAYKIATHAKSACAVVVKDLRTLGICCSQDNEINALEFALNKVCDSTKDSVVAFDGAIESINDIQIMAQNRVIGAIATGGSLKDNEIIELADKMNIALISTGIRHFKH